MPTDDSSLPPIIVSTEVQPPLSGPPTPWGFWATLGFSAVIAGAYILAQSFAVGFYVAFTGGPAALKAFDIEKIVSNGKVLVLITLCSAPVSIGLCVLFAWMRNGITVRDYLALRWPPLKIVVKWLLLCVVFLSLVDIGTSFIEGHQTQNFMRQTLDSIGSLMPLLWVVLLVAAPVSEEFFFRGFLFAGLARSRLGPVGAILVTALLFMSIHLQYDLQGLIFVLFLGLILAIARWKTGSLLVCILLHAMMNFIATITFIYFGDKI